MTLSYKPGQGEWMKIFVVIGTCGEYSDRTEWLVQAFHNEDDAKARVAMATARAKIIQSKKDYDDPSYWSRKPEINPYDSSMQGSYTDTSYYYESVELE